MPTVSASVRTGWVQYSFSRDGNKSEPGRTTIFADPGDRTMTMNARAA